MTLRYSLPLLVRKAKPGQDFFPLTVNYQERTYAAGKIPGGFFRREGRPSEGETLIARLIDRPVRPLFPEGFVNEVQVIATVVSVNPQVNPDIVAMIGASARCPCQVFRSTVLSVLLALVISMTSTF